MAFYLIRAKLRTDKKDELYSRLQKKEFVELRPFGIALTLGLENALSDPKTGEILWEEEDYCSPPLAMERAAVLDKYFDDIRVESLPAGEGWGRISDLPALWGDIEQT